MNKIYHLFEKIFRTCNRYILRKKLRNKDFSLITNTCVGGIMCHELGVRFLSPMVNVGFEDKDFPKFAKNLRWYMQQPLKFIDTNEPWPVAYCGDILMHFVHYHTIRDAEEKWYARRERINYNNLFFICGDRTDFNRENGVITYEDIASLKEIPCKGKVVFSIRHYDDIDYIFPLPKDPNGDFIHPYTSDRSKILRKWSWEGNFDYVHWFNTGEVKHC